MLTRRSFSLIALLALLAASPAGFASPAAFAAEAAPAGSTLTTDGAGEVSVPADGAVVELGVQGRGDSAAAASATAARRLHNLLAALRELGAAIETPVSTGYNVAADWRWEEESGERHLVGYTATSGLRVVVVDLERLGAVIDAALAGDADDVGTPRFTSSREREARDRALAVAYGAARRDAEVLARAAGGSLGPLAELTTNPAVFRGGEAFDEMAVTGKGPGVEIENPEVTVRVTVAGKWYLAPR